MARDVTGSAVAGSLITALFTKAQSDKSAIIENIIRERKKWRNRLRDLMSDVESCFKNKDSDGIASIEAKLVVGYFCPSTRKGKN